MMKPIWQHVAAICAMMIVGCQSDRYAGSTSVGKVSLYPPASYEGLRLSLEINGREVHPGVAFELTKTEATNVTAELWIENHLPDSIFICETDLASRYSVFSGDRFVASGGYGHMVRSGVVPHYFVGGTHGRYAHGMEKIFTNTWSETREWTRCEMEYSIALLYYPFGQRCGFTNSVSIPVELRVVDTLKEQPANNSVEPTRALSGARGSP